MLSAGIKSLKTTRMKGGSQSDIHIEGGGDVIGGNKITKVYQVRDTKLAKLFRRLKEEVDEDDGIFESAKIIIIELPIIQGGTKKRSMEKSVITPIIL